jgi:hypothetical protein
MEPLLNWLVGETIIYGTTIENWMFVAASIFILWILYRLIMGPFTK